MIPASSNRPSRTRAAVGFALATVTLASCSPGDSNEAQSETASPEQSDASEATEGLGATDDTAETAAVDDVGETTSPAAADLEIDSDNDPE